MHRAFVPTTRDLGTKKVYPLFMNANAELCVDALSKKVGLDGNCTTAPYQGGCEGNLR